MTRNTNHLPRRTVLKSLGATAALAGASGLVEGQPNGRASARLELVGHSTIGARDGGNTYGAVDEDLGLAAVGSFFLGNNELRLVDISEPTDPAMVSTIGTDPDGHSTDIRNVAIHQSDPLVLVANEGGEDAGWAMVDVEDFSALELIGPFTVEDAPSGTHNIESFGDDYVLAVGHGRGLVVYDITDRENHVEVSDFQMPEAGEGDDHDHEAEGEAIHAAHVRGDHAYLTHWNLGMYVLDLSDPAEPEVVAAFDYSEEEADVPLRNAHHAVPHPSKDICLVGEEVGGGLPGYNHLVEFDLDTGETELRSSFQFPQHAQQPTGNQGFWWTGHFLDWGIGDHEDVPFSGDYKAGFQTFDLSDQEHPVRIDQYLPTEWVGEVRAKNPDRLGLVDHVPFSWGMESALAGDVGLVYSSDVTTGLYVMSLVGYLSRRGRDRSHWTRSRVARSHRVTIGLGPPTRDPS